MSQVLVDQGAWRQQSTPLFMGPGSSTQVGADPELVMLLAVIFRLLQA